MKKLTFAFVTAVGFLTASFAAENAVDDAMRGAGSGATSALLVSTEGGNDKPDFKSDYKPGGEGGGSEGGGSEGGGSEGGGSEGGGTPPGSGGSSDSVVLTGAYQYTCETNTLAGATLTSTTSDQNVLLAQTNALVTVSNCVLNKSGDTSDEDNSNFFALNAVVAAKSGSLICIDNSTLNCNADGANFLFASGVGSTIYAYRCTLVGTNGYDSARGLDATYKGKVIASEMSITTTGDHCASLATDRGNGYISVTGASLSTGGQGSPLIYSTGAIEVNSVTGEATRAQIAGIEGLSTIRIANSDLTGSGERASEPLANGVIIYQSNSGDSTDGTATFEVSDSTLSSAITNGAMFYITHSEAVITVKNTALNFDTAEVATNYLLKAAGNDGDNGWGTEGANGGDVVFTAIDQTLTGNVLVDGISSLDFYLTNSTYTGTFVQDTTYTGTGGSDVFISADSRWIVTADCTLQNLTASPGATIEDASGKTVSIVNTNGAKHVTGTSALTITVSDYISGTFATTNITEFSIDRSDYEAIYGTSGSEAGESGGSSDTGSKTYYIKPHAPTNGVVGVTYNGTKIFPDMDHKYWLDAYWTNGVTLTIDFSSDITSGYFFADGSTVTSLVMRITENKTEVYPPAGFETAYLAQAKSGATYYRTLKEAIDAAKDRSRIILNDNVTLEETLTVTNSITLDLCSTNVLTLGSALTNAFHFTAGGTVSNGTINSSLAANVEDSVLMRFTDCKVTLKDLTINGRGYETVVARDSATSSLSKKNAMTCDGLVLTGNGCLLSVDYANATLTNDCAFTFDDTLASFGEHAAAIYCTSDGTVSILGGTYTAPTVLLADDYGVFYKSDDVTIAAPDGYVWENGLLVEASSADAITPGVASEPYGDAQSATNAAATINSDKASCIAVPNGVADSAVDTYLSMVAATVTSDNRVVVDLTPAAEQLVQCAVDEAVTNESAVASLTSTNASATATIDPTTPGLYYWIVGGTDVGAVTNAGTGVLSTNGGAVELTKPTLDATKGRAFFKIAAGVSSPSNDD